MTTTLVAPTETQLQLVSSQHFDTWRKQGQGLFHHLQATENALELSQWKIGDWLIEGDDTFGEKAYQTAEQITGWTRETLYNVVWVTKKFPAGSLRSENALKWSHFKELASIEDDQVRERLLDKFNDGFPYSVRDVRDRVHKELAKSKKKKTESSKEQAKKWVFLRVSLEPDHGGLVKTLAEIRRTPQDVLLRKIVTDYFKQRKILAEIDRAQKSQLSKAR